MGNRLISFLDKYAILKRNQFGFRRGMSTEDAIIDVTESIYRNLNDRKHTMSVFVDFSKAFDTVNHSILLSKMWKYGIRGRAHSWFDSYLKDRGQRVRVNGVCSDRSLLSVGVPQGSVLGPVLFLIYVNNMCDAISLSKTVQFADDTTLLLYDHNHSTLTNAATSSLAQLSSWCFAHRLSINTSKTVVMLFSNRQFDIDLNNKVSLCNAELCYVDNVKFLGLTVDNRLKFNVHIADVCKKVSRVVGVLYKVRDILPTKTLINLYYALFYPHVIYTNLIWGGTSNVHLHTLEMLQKKAVRVITSSNYLTHTRPLFYQTGILNI